MLLLCVQWTGERFRVEINVKFKDPEVYIWGERRASGRSSSSRKSDWIEQAGVYA